MRFSVLWLRHCEGNTELLDSSRGLVVTSPTLVSCTIASINHQRRIYVTATSVSLGRYLYVTVDQLVSANITTQTTDRGINRTTSRRTLNAMKQSI